MFAGYFTNAERNPQRNRAPKPTETRTRTRDENFWFTVSTLSVKHNSGFNRFQVNLQQVRDPTMERKLSSVSVEDSVKRTIGVVEPEQEVSLFHSQLIRRGRI